jgi:NAD(P)-dependent dehydrogenase (short-subunit alcohol dehydrogenase family)
MSKVIVTGGLGALGQAVAQAFIESGHAVALIDRAPYPDNGGPAVIGGVDLVDPAAAAQAFAQASRMLGGADVLVNVAGGFRFERLRDGDPETWKAMFAVNLETCANMCRVAASGLSDGGAIVNIGAAAAERAGAGMAPYTAAKAGVARLTESLAAELGGRIRVNAVLPAILDTPQNRAEMPDVDPAAWTAPRAVAEVIVFLASDAGRAINGALVPVTAPASY